MPGLQRGYRWTASSRDAEVPPLTGVAGRCADSPARSATSAINRPPQTMRRQPLRRKTRPKPGARSELIEPSGHFRDPDHGTIVEPDAESLRAVQGACRRPWIRSITRVVPRVLPQASAQQASQAIGHADTYQSCQVRIRRPLPTNIGRDNREDNRALKQEPHVSSSKGS